MQPSIAALKAFRHNIDAAYQLTSNTSCELDVLAGVGTLADIQAFVRQAGGGNA